MNHRNETVDVLHTISAPKKGVPKGVARHGGTRRIREWGPSLTILNIMKLNGYT